ncbi:MAG: FAD-dependent oxidoreductase [Flavobacteriales bacterium]|nr:MAG: FAD-dependent oxidoreductase [Flavobacteriales bacterium]
MERTVDIVLPPVEAADPVLVRQAAEEAAGLARGRSRTARVLKRSIDARSRQPRIRLRVLVSDAALAEAPIAPPALPDAGAAPPVVIVGAGPAGLFCALRAIERGLRPIVLERGKDVRARRRDLAAINRLHTVDPDSNYCFGEGGAGTYSDGKLYTRSHKRGDVEGVLRTLVAYGASPDILVDAHPHIGTNKLPGIITAMREAILGAGGAVHFGTRVTDLVLEQGRVRGVRTATGAEHLADAVVLATGHSARDIFGLLRAKGIRIERKDFALGVRVEHPQAIIDRAQYHCAVRDPYLPPASYSLVQQVEGLGVYSFCMCPGGIIAPCATAPDEVVTNGWSPSKRNNPFANSGVVVEARGNFAAADPLAGMAYQRDVEHAAWIAGGRTQVAPAQRLEDFIQGRLSADLPECSYPPGILSHRVDQLLPREIGQRLREGFKAFGQKMRGYRTNEAVVVAVESRTSSPVRIPRDPQSLQHASAPGLFPCGEGAGYAGGIVSAAMDGQRVADAVAAAVLRR